MTTIMKAKEAADQVYENVKQHIEEWKGRGHEPRLAVILVAGDPASAYYAQSKQKIAQRLGIAFDLYEYPEQVHEDEILQQVARLNTDPEVHGIMLELPLPKHLSAGTIVNAITPWKDIDGVTPSNQRATITGEVGLYPATPQACIQLLKHYGYPLEGKNVTLIGRGQTVGLPLFHLLQHEQATVTVCHSRTPDIAMHLSHADIAIAAVGRAHMIQPDMVHGKLVFIDAGINETDEGKIVGDISPDVAQHVQGISPVPGGVGTLTTAILYQNLMKAIRLQKEVR
ncbi:bifunctional 5,10-methylenetetrahydrofolate dehydrogenase/5,10-methenyltetrahydrofolate cyclohydrolase [Paenibacillus terrigena]|uniref:bifunctional 5,10-methylenetetrahydrofolate dehydrogenase/5,10-methenyltetrahydrofolate cyclohydrolase n=1 Tax=Paenibacillus terrigena TaxID=369333 RepID=UPI0028D66B17|nr:bifunctional 5,10-methylenetetrahydrofolate dehydrogenase/5,10-methenyltetrahydrofolate cyclohydrolase [Paenibacillus terrigena]